MVQVQARCSWLLVPSCTYRMHKMVVAVVVNHYHHFFITSSIILVRALIFLTFFCCIIISSMVSFSSIISLSTFSASVFSITAPFKLSTKSYFTSSNIFMTELLVVSSGMSSIFTFTDGQIWNGNVYLSIILNIILHRCGDFLSQWNRRQAIIFLHDSKAPAYSSALIQWSILFFVSASCWILSNFVIFIRVIHHITTFSTTPSLLASLILSSFLHFFLHDHPPFLPTILLLIASALGSALGIVQVPVPPSLLLEPASYRARFASALSHAESILSVPRLLSLVDKWFFSKGSHKSAWHGWQRSSFVPPLPLYALCFWLSVWNPSRISWRSTKRLNWTQLHQTP